jgi:hypothetical protein
MTAVDDDPPLPGQPEMRMRVKVDLPGLPNMLRGRLQHLLHLVVFGHRAAENTQGWDMSVPGSVVTLQLSSHPDVWNPDITQKSFFAWQTRNALRDGVEAFSAYLEQVREVCGVWKVSTLAQPDGTLRGADWNKHYLDERRRFHGLGLPHKMTFLSDRYNVTLPPAKLEYLLSINRVRNCLVHRDGAVMVDDIPPTHAEVSEALQRRRSAYPREKWSTGQMVTALDDAGHEFALKAWWLTFETSVETTKGETKVWTGEPLLVNKGDRVGLRVREVRQDFGLGTHIVLKPADFAEICLTLSVLSGDLVSSLEASGRAMGVKFQEVADAPAG